MNTTPRTFSIRGTGEPISLKWRLRSPRDLWRTWHAFSDTDRFNRAGRLGHRIEETVEADGTVTRSGRMRELGMQLHWLERAFDYQQPTGFRAEREFLNGPARGYVLNVQIHATDAGTQVDYRVTGYAKWWWIRPLTWIVFMLRVRPSVGRALKRIIDSLEQNQIQPLESKHPLSKEVLQRLTDACETLPNRKLATHLSELLGNGDDIEQARLEPVRLASHWKMPVDLVVDGLLSAVQKGILRLHCDLLCPSCHGPKERLSKLVLQGVAPHCSSCNIYYDADLAENVVISFQTTLHQVDDTASCVGNPSATPHLLARRDLQPMEIHDFELDLQPGRYRIRRQDALLGAVLHVTEEGPNQVGFSLEATGFGPEIARVGSGKVLVWLRNASNTTVRVAIEDACLPMPGITLAQILSRPETQALIPDGILPPNLNLKVERHVVIQLEKLHPDPSLVAVLQERLIKSTPNWFEDLPRFLRFGWATVEDALQAMEQIIGSSECCSSLSVGTLMQFEGADGIRHGGPTLEQGRKALSITVPGGCSLTQETAENSSIRPQIVNRKSVNRIIPGPPIHGRQDSLIQFVGHTDWSSRKAPDKPEPVSLIGRTIRNRYRLSGILGAGGYGTVFEAIDEEMNQDVVLKLLHPHRTDDPYSIQSFFDEARACMSLDSPYIVRMMDFGHTEDGLLFCVMEQLLGRAMSELSNDFITINRVSNICMDVGRGLMAVHKANLVHRDIKPSNIFVVRDADGRSRGRIIDFGIAIHLTEQNPLNRNDRITGSLPYISPEQIDGTPASPASDIYALGMVMHLCFVGHHPFDDLGGVPQLMKRVAEAIPSIKTSCPFSLPTDLINLIDACLDRNPDKRPESAHAFVEQLGACLHQIKQQFPQKGSDLN